MRLQGILGKTFGGFACIRGFASFGDLERISSPNEGFQRDLISTHSERMKEFLLAKEYLFFPEVILAYTLKYNFNAPNAKTGYDPLTDILARKTFVSNVDKIKIWAQKSGVHKITVSITEGFLKKNKPFDRIDGNHRLSSVTLDPSFKDYIIPFCIILLGDDTESEAKKRVIFHNINYKSEPLTPEQNYSLIIDEKNKDVFSDETLKTNNREFGWAFYLSRKLLPKITLEEFPELGDSFTKYDDSGKDYTVIRTFLIQLSQLLLDKGLITETEQSIDKLYSEINSVNLLYKNELALGKAENPNLVIAFIYYNLTNETDKQFNAFKNWVLANKIHELEDLNANEIIDLFHKRMEARKGDIFISMDFSKYYEKHYVAIKEAVTDFNKNNKLTTAIKELRMDKVRQGSSFNIYDEMYKMIENSSLLIADLSNGNTNVYNEIGYLMGLNRGRGIEDKNFILIVHKNAKEELVSFNLKPYQRIIFTDETDLKQEILNSLEIHFGIKPPEN